VAWIITGATSCSFTASRWSPWFPTSASRVPSLEVMIVSPAKAALSRPWIDGRLSKKV
jgi:hypothetical protein